MRAIIQRVLSSSVTIDGSIFSSIDQGLLVLLGVTEEDSEEDVVYLVHKRSLRCVSLEMQKER